MEHDHTRHLIKMANQIGDFFESQTPDDPEAGARAVASHLKLFWAPTMRAELAAEFDAGHADELIPTVARAFREHRTALLVEGAHVRGEASQTFPQGGGDAG